MRNPTCALCPSLNVDIMASNCGTFLKQSMSSISRWALLDGAIDDYFGGMIESKNFGQWEMRVMGVMGDVTFGRSLLGSSDIL